MNLDHHFMNQMIENRRLSMMPPIFVTYQEAWETRRKNMALQNQIFIGGKFFCFHDWTWIGPAIRKHLLDWGDAHLCVKCGKYKVFTIRRIEPIAPNQSLK